jgi:hypothetical protein
MSTAVHRTHPAPTAPPPPILVCRALIAMDDGEPARWITVLSPGGDLSEAHRELALRFGAERLLDVVEHRAGRMS